jgi:hypothetical protein
LKQLESHLRESNEEMEMQICSHILSKILQNGSGVIEKLWLLQIAIFIFSSMPSLLSDFFLSLFNDGIVFVPHTTTRSFAFCRMITIAVVVVVVVAVAKRQYESSTRFSWHTMK